MYATCPASAIGDATRYEEHIGEVARWCDAAGIKGALIYTDNSLADPWLVAQLAVRASRSFVPLVAVQPFYQHPFTVARAVGSIALLHSRRVDLNFVSGGFRCDLASLGDDIDADDRYHRLVEYVDVVMRLLTGERVTFGGQYFRLASARLLPPTSTVPSSTRCGSVSPVARPSRGAGVRTSTVGCCGSRTCQASVISAWQMRMTCGWPSRNLGSPLVVKPVTGVASREVWLWDSIADAEAFLAGLAARRLPITNFTI